MRRTSRNSAETGEASRKRDPKAPTSLCKIDHPVLRQLDGIDYFVPHFRHSNKGQPSSSQWSQFGQYRPGRYRWSPFTVAPSHNSCGTWNVTLRELLSTQQKGGANGPLYKRLRPRLSSTPRGSRHRRPGADHRAECSSRTIRRRSPSKVRPDHQFGGHQAEAPLRYWPVITLSDLVAFAP